MQSSPWKHFSYEELACRCGQCGPKTGQQMDRRLMDKVQSLRERCGMPLVISSAYRCANHPAEKQKLQLGTHHQGLAVDILVQGKDAYHLLRLAMEMCCFSGIGINQTGSHSHRFIHLDVATGVNRPWVWSY